MIIENPITLLTEIFDQILIEKPIKFFVKGEDFIDEFIFDNK